jgi:hypothetical protein
MKEVGMATRGNTGYLLHGELKGVELLGPNLILLTVYKYSNPEASVEELRRLPKGVLAVYFKKLDGR